MDGGKVSNFAVGAGLLSCRRLMAPSIMMSGIDASGKKGIFPSNYVSDRSDKSREVFRAESRGKGGRNPVAWSTSTG